MNALEALHKAYASPSMEKVAAPPLSGIHVALGVPAPDCRAEASVQPSVATMFSQVSRATHVAAITLAASGFRAGDAVSQKKAGRPRKAPVEPSAGDNEEDNEIDEEKATAMAHVVLNTVGGPQKRSRRLPTLRTGVA